MASYAAVMTLTDLMDRIHSLHHTFTAHHQIQLQFLREKVSFIQHFLESSHYNYSDCDDHHEIRVLESRISDAAYLAEDVIESYVVDHVLSRSKNLLEKMKFKMSKKFTQDVEKVIGDFDSLTEALEIQEKSEVLKNPLPQETDGSGSSRVLNTEKDFLVGFDDILNQVTDKLTGYASDRQVIALTGMGGIGKSTLAKKVYDNLCGWQHFDVCAWVTVSQVFNVHDLLIQLLKECGKGQLGERSADELGEILHKHLFGRRYFIVIDDIWSLDAWNGIRRFHPENNNRSRIIVTTRLLNLATDIGSCHIYKVNLLDEDDSWSLLRRKVFVQESCPHDLEEVGKKIARKCKGLPLSIVVISGLLKKSLNREYWECIKEDVSANVNSEGNEHCLKMLRLSYSHLHVHLKPCLFYLGVFPEDDRIKVSHLKKLWVAEGFLKPKEGKSLEEVASYYLKDLIDRNLILVDELGSTGNVKWIKVHDLVRDFCLKEANKERFLYVYGKPNLDLSQGFASYRRLAVYNEEQKSRAAPTFDATQSWPSLRSIVGTCEQLPSDVKLLRVWNVRSTSRDKKIELVGCNLRCLLFPNTPITNIRNFVTSTHRSWNIQTIICSRYDQTSVYAAPFEIWDMPQLRHLMIIGRVYLRGLSYGKMDVQLPKCSVLRDLQSLGVIIDFCCTEEVLRMLPNIKKLRIRYCNRTLLPPAAYCLDNLIRLDKLESLQCGFLIDESLSLKYFQNMGFSLSLKKLKLFYCGFSWEEMGRKIGSLPHLEKLGLDNCGGGKVWNCVDDQFLKLKYLEIRINFDDSNNCLVEWTADSSHFPSLEHISLWSVSKMEEISPEIGEIPSLRLIQVIHCCDTVREMGKDDTRRTKEIWKSGSYFSYWWNYISFDFEYGA